MDLGGWDSVPPSESGFWIKKAEIMANIFDDKTADQSASTPPRALGEQPGGLRSSTRIRILDMDLGGVGQCPTL